MELVGVCFIFSLESRKELAILRISYYGFEVSERNWWGVSDISIKRSSMDWEKYLRCII